MTDVVERLLAGAGGGKHWMDLHTEAANEIIRLRAALEWQSIETAPKDGTLFLSAAIREREGGATMTTTREEAIEMSREAGFYYDTGVIERHLERFIHLIDLARAKENEECAGVSDKAADETETFGYRAVHRAIAKRIRARMK